MSEKKIILVCDDDEDDRFFAKVAIQSNLENENEIDIYFVHDGEELIDYLLKQNKYAEIDAPQPSVIFLDIQMPKLNGLDALNQIKGNKKLKHIPIIMLSSSGLESDINSSYSRGANSYLIKPNILNDLTEMMKNMKKFWIDTAELPSKLELSEGEVDD